MNGCEIIRVFVKLIDAISLVDDVDFYDDKLLLKNLLYNHLEIHAHDYRVHYLGSYERIAIMCGINPMNCNTGLADRVQEIPIEYAAPQFTTEEFYEPIKEHDNRPWYIAAAEKGGHKRKGKNNSHYSNNKSKGFTPQNKRLR